MQLLDLEFSPDPCSDQMNCGMFWNNLLFVLGQCKRNRERMAMEIFGEWQGRKGRKSTEQGWGRLNLFPALPAAWWVTPAKSLHCSMPGLPIYKMKTLITHLKCPLFLVMEINMLKRWILPSESSPGIHFAVRTTYNQHEASNTTSTVGQMVEAQCACRLWGRKLSRESSYSELLPALKFLQLKIGAKENLQPVQHELCSAQRWKTKIKTIKPVTLSKQVGKRHKLLVRY